MKSINASQLKNQFGQTMDEALSEPVVIKKHGRASVVMLSAKHYQKLTEAAQRGGYLETEEAATGPLLAAAGA